MQCCPSLNGGKNCLSFTQPVLLGNFKSLKTKVSCLFKLTHITEETNKLYDTVLEDPVISPPTYSYMVPKHFLFDVTMASNLECRCLCFYGATIFD